MNVPPPLIISNTTTVTSIGKQHNTEESPHTQQHQNVPPLINFQDQKYISCSSVMHCDPTAAAAQQELNRIQQSQVVLPFVESVFVDSTNTNKGKDIRCTRSDIISKGNDSGDPLEVGRHGIVSNDNKSTADKLINIDNDDDNDDDEPTEEDKQLVCLVCENPCDGKWPTVGTDRHPTSGKWGVITWSCCGPSCSKFYLGLHYGHRANRLYGYDSVCFFSCSAFLSKSKQTAIFFFDFLLVLRYQTEMQQVVFGIHDIIVEAPNPRLLMKHRGPWTRKKYNRMLYKRNVLVYLADDWFYPLPMKIVATQIHPNSTTPSVSDVSSILPKHTPITHTENTGPDAVNPTTKKQKTNTMSSSTIESHYSPAVHNLSQTIDSNTLTWMGNDDQSLKTLNATNVAAAAAASKHRALQTMTSTDSIACKKSMVDFFSSNIVDPIQTSSMVVLEERNSIDGLKSNDCNYNHKAPSAANI